MKVFTGSEEKLPRITVCALCHSKTGCLNPHLHEVEEGVCSGCGQFKERIYVCTGFRRLP